MVKVEVSMVEAAVPREKVDEGMMACVNCKQASRVTERWGKQAE